MIVAIHRIHLFEGVHGCVFIASLAEYNQPGEDGTGNGLRESIAVFKEILETPALKESKIVLFLNKVSDRSERARGRASKRARARETILGDRGASNSGGGTQFCTSRFSQLVSNVHGRTICFAKRSRSLQLGTSFRRRHKRKKGKITKMPWISLGVAS